MQATRDYCHGMFNHSAIVKDKYRIIQAIYMKLCSLIIMYPCKVDDCAVSKLLLEASSVFCGVYGGHCMYPFGTVKNETNNRPSDGFLNNKKAIGWHQDIGSSYCCDCQASFLCSGKATITTRVFYWWFITAIIYRHWIHSNLLPCGYQSSSTSMYALDDLPTSQYLRVPFGQGLDYICAYAICDDDVSLTPTKKVAWWQQLLMWWILYLLWVEWDGALLYCEGSLAAMIYVRQCGLPYLGPIICIWGLLP